MLRLHYLQHEPEVPPAHIVTYARTRGWNTSRTALYEGEKLPDLADFDLLVILGGTMNVYESDKHMWLPPEKEFIARCIGAGKKILGLCLGGQLLADCLGGKVAKNHDKEIGWHRLKLTGNAATQPFLNGFPDRLSTFQWHEDTFAIPDGAVRFAESKCCANQGFIYGDRVIALQFHLEVDEESIGLMLETFDEPAGESPYVQTAREIKALTKRYIADSNRALETMLDNLTAA
jgi:GMP synthase-like glutamine amidotransferase